MYTRHEEEGNNIALFQDILQFSGTVRGINGNEDQSCFGGSHLEQGPFWKIRRPDSDMLSLAQTKRQQAASYLVGPVSILLVRPTDIERAAKLRVTGIDNRFLRRNFTCTTV